MLDKNVTAAYVAAGLGSATIAFNHVNTFWDLAEKLQPRQQLADKDTVLIRLWMRARHWLATVVRLDRVSDLQAVSIANRTLFELAVDMLLIGRDKSNESGRKLTLWSESDRIKHFEYVVKHYEESGQQLPTQFAENLEFHQSEKAAIDKIRAHYWPHKKDNTKGTHPSRWTGHDLFHDLTILDDSPIEKELILLCVRMPLGSVYREEGKPLNWSIHSGTAGPWSSTEIGELHASLGTAFGRCGDFGMLCTMALLNEYTPSDLAMEVYRDFLAVDKERSDLYKTMKRVIETESA